ncbi:DUF7373 family lipoprotein [Nocardia nova]|uniref:DUF7373 family lipoprotein n=1 Tax=Nocardia nova TaxID=37330 RepID=UPI0033E0AD49
MDTGSYSTDPIDMRYRYLPSLQFGSALASSRLLDKVALGTEIDPSLTFNDVTQLTSDKDDYYLNKYPPSLIAALRQNSMLYGVLTEKKQKYTSDPEDGDEKINITVFQFPDNNSAQNAAKAYENADFAIAADKNQAVQLNKYPNALSHWRPGIRTIGSRLVEGSYLVNIFARAPQPELPQLTSLLEHIYDVQLPMLRTLPPLSKRDILHLPYDPNGMYSRTFTPKDFVGPGLRGDGSFTTRAFLNTTDSDDKVLTDKGRVDAVSNNVYNTILWRSPSEEDARSMAGELRNRMKMRADPPIGIPDSFCDEDGDAQDWEHTRYRCVVRYGRYTARVASSQIKDAQQRAAAQYAILANSW